MPVCQVTVVPLGTATPSLSSYVAGCQKILDGYPGLSYQLTPMATVIEGPLEDVLAAVSRMHQVPFEMGALRVATTLVIDDRRDKDLTMKGKVASVESKLSADTSSTPGKDS
jgi:uncharacterized protein (TIGR00106 family)